jgi:transcriptional regulator with XRE-family HTH domain
MKGSSDFRNTLGISQEEAAMLLGVSRSQFSLFELGKRSLPTNAMVTYVEMWTYVQEQVKKKEGEDAHTVLDKEKVKMFIETELAETQYKQKFLQKKILATKAKFNKAQAALHLVEY